MTIRGLRRVLRPLMSAAPTPLILMYHRIADTAVDPWGLAVSPARFAEQMHVLRRTRHPLPLSDFVHRLRAGVLPARAVAVTFDDGYLDNLVAAKAILDATDVPATVFLATGFLGRPGPFWWDELASLVLLGDAPPSVELTVRGCNVQFDLGQAPPGRRDRDWRAWSTPGTERQATYVALCETLRPLSESERQELMTALRSVFVNASCPGESGRAMTPEEVRALASGGLIEIGAHSVTHPVLTELDIACRRREIAASKAACEALTEAPVVAFAYPYGKFNAQVQADLRTAGFAFACSTIPGAATAASDSLALPRIHILDWSGDDFDWALCSAAVRGLKGRLSDWNPVRSRL